MTMPAERSRREERREELLRLWKQPKGQLQVLGLFHRLNPDSSAVQAGMSVLDAILEAEFGSGNAGGEGL